MRRRTFLATAIASSVHLRAAGRPVRIGVLGAVHSHAAAKIKVLQGLPDFELVGVFEENTDVREEYRRRGVRMVSLDELLSDKSITSIAVESDVPDHCRHGLMAIEAGKHLHLEKPPALDIASFQNLLNAAAARSRVVQVGYMWRYHPGFMMVSDAVRSGWLGPLYRIDANINKSLDPSRRGEWARFRGGQMFELGCHVIDPLVRLLGRPERITPFLKSHGKWDDNFADNTAAVLEYPAAMGLVTGSALDPNGNRHRSFAVRGASGTATLTRIEGGELELDLSKPAGPYAAGLHSIKLPEYRRYVDDFHDFAAAVRGISPVSVTPEQELLVQECVIKASGM